MNISINNINFYGTPNKNIVTNIAKSSAAAKNSATSSSLQPKGCLNEYTMKLLSEIRDLFEAAHSAIKATAKSCNTRSSIKNGYSNLKKGVAGSRILEFRNIGYNGEDLSVNLRIDHGKDRKTIIFIGDKQLVINAKGNIEKNPTLRFIGEQRVRSKSESLQFFSQNEIDNLNAENQLFALKNELKKYIDYIISRQKDINKIRAQKADNIPGSVDVYKSLIEEISNNFNYFKTNINKLSYNKLDKDIFRIFNNIKTFHAQNSILLKDAATDGRSIFLGYSKINKKKAMKIFIMDYNNKNIDKSFVIYENKLAKFHPKKVNKKPNHLDYDFHYYTQEEINNSGLKEYLNQILERLKYINDNLRTGIEERKAKNNIK